MLKLDGEWPWLKLSNSEEERECHYCKGIQKESRPSWSCFKGSELGAKPQLQSHTFRKLAQEDCHDFEASPNYNNYKASQGYMANPHLKIKINRNTQTKLNYKQDIGIPKTSVSPQALMAPKDLNTMSPQTLMGCEPTGRPSLDCSQPQQMPSLTTM